MNKVLIPIVFSFLLLILPACTQTKPNQPPEPAKLLISAAASLQDALTEIQKGYKESHPDVKVNFNFGSSGSLQQQIEQGAPVDVFISAGQSQMDQLDKQDLLTRNSRVNLLANSLVLITAKDNNKVSSLKSLTNPEIGKIGLGTPETVPAGKYAKEALINLKLWDSLQPKLVPAKDVRQVLAYVETGNADAGLVYLSDTFASNKIKIVEQLPSSSHSPIVYPAAVIKGSKNPLAAQNFLAYLQTPPARQVFERYGFKQP